MKKQFNIELSSWEKILIITGFIVGFVFEYIDEFILASTREGPDIFPSYLSFWDTYILLLINPGLYNPYFAYVCIAISYIAGTAGMFYLSLILYTIGRKREALLLFATLIMGSIILLPLKLMIPRYRPYETNTHVVTIIKQAGNSFPSGHASRGFELAALFDRKGKKISVLLYTYAVIVALSRLYLGVHYPLDVLVGGTIGWATGKIILRYQNRVIGSVSKLLKLPAISND